MSLLVTGGAGFIGSNFVLDWIAQSNEPVINLDKLTYGMPVLTTDYWAPEFERSLAAWNDPAIGIQWPIQGEPSLSAKDQQAKALAEAEHFA